MGSLYFDDNRVVICEVTLSSHPGLRASFHPLSLLSVVYAKKGHFIKSQYEMLNLSIYYTRSKTNYSSCTVRRRENIRSSSGGAQEEEKTA